MWRRQIKCAPAPIPEPPHRTLGMSGLDRGGTSPAGDGSTETQSSKQGRPSFSQPLEELLHPGKLGGGVPRGPFPLPLVLLPSRAQLTTVRDE